MRTTWPTWRGSCSRTSCCAIAASILRRLRDARGQNPGGSQPGRASVAGHLPLRRRVLLSQGRAVQVPGMDSGKPDRHCGQGRQFPGRFRPRPGWQMAAGDDRARHLCRRLAESEWRMHFCNASVSPLPRGNGPALHAHQGQEIRLYHQPQVAGREAQSSLVKPECRPHPHARPERDLPWRQDGDNWSSTCQDLQDEASDRAGKPMPSRWNRSSGRSLPTPCRTKRLPSESTKIRRKKPRRNDGWRVPFSRVWVVKTRKISAQNVP